MQYVPVNTSIAPEKVITALGLEQISDRTALEPIVRRVVEDNPKPVGDYRAGKTKALHALKGMVMRETRGKANPVTVDHILVELLRESPAE